MSGRSLCGLVLAAGAGSRFGSPKALARDAAGTPWLALAVAALRSAGCRHVLVALGAQIESAAPLVPADAVIVRVPDWADGLSASLRAGLRAAMHTSHEAVVVTPVDTPDAPPDAAARLVGSVGSDLETALAQAVYGGMPGHPVLIGRSHWEPLSAAVSGDRGARPYLVAHGVLEIECGDLWSGADRDTPS